MESSSKLQLMAFCKSILNRHNYLPKVLRNEQRFEEIGIDKYFSTCFVCNNLIYEFYLISEANGIYQESFACKKLVDWVICVLRFRDTVGNNATGRISKRIFQENKARQIFQKTTISYMCVSGSKKCYFSENLASFVFFEHPLWVSPFCLITDDTKYTVFICKLINIHSSESFIHNRKKKNYFIPF